MKEILVLGNAAKNEKQLTAVEHTLRLLCDALNTGDIELLRGILAEDAVLDANRHGEIICGTDRVLAVLKDFHGLPSLHYVAHLVEIIENKTPVLEFQEGTECVILTDTSEHYEGLVLPITNEAGKIERIITSPGYGSLVWYK